MWLNKNYVTQITGEPGLYAQAHYPCYEPPSHPVESLWLVLELEETNWYLVFFISTNKNNGSYQLFRECPRKDYSLLMTRKSKRG